MLLEEKKINPKQNHPVSLWCPKKNLRGGFSSDQPSYISWQAFEGWKKPKSQPVDQKRVLGWPWQGIPAGWWLVEPPIWKICASQNGFIFPNVQGENSKNIWNHHPARFWVLVTARCLMKMPLWVYDSLRCLGILGVILRNPQIAVNPMSSLETLHIMSVAKGVMTRKIDVV